MTRQSPEQRQQALLDGAAALFVRQGFDKTAVADIATAAGVSKGAFYLGFDSKESLLDALIRREMQRYAQHWMQSVEADPNGGTIGGMYRCALLALQRNPVVSALMRGDALVFGSFLRKHAGTRAGKSGPTRREFVAAMQAAGAIRPELDPAVTAHIMNMLSYGLVSMAQVMDRADIPDSADVIAGIADILDRALSPPGGGDSETGKRVLRALFNRTAHSPARHGDMQ